MAPVQDVGQEAPPAASASAGGATEAAGQQVAALALADIGNSLDRRDDPPESTIGGETTCIVCMEQPKSHLATPCGHQCVCGTCAEQMVDCPYCRQPVASWFRVRIV